MSKEIQRTDAPNESVQLHTRRVLNQQEVSANIYSNATDSAPPMRPTMICRVSASSGSFEVALADLLAAVNILVWENALDAFQCVAELEK